MMSIKPELVLAQQLNMKPVHHVSELAKTFGSRPSAYRALKELMKLGFAQHEQRGYFTLRSSIHQPYDLWPYLLPSLNALKNARCFGKTYDEYDAKRAHKMIQGMITLDYRAYELTKLQNPRTMFIYANDMDDAAGRLKSEGYSEGEKGRVVLMSRIGDFSNEIQRVYLDCLAAGGRYVLGAIAIELLHGEALKIKGVFPIELVNKVEDDLPK